MNEHEQPVWTAKWIWDKGVPRSSTPAHEVRLFRRTFTAPEGARLVVRVSADSRYQLFVNGRKVSIGPCKGDAWRKFYETVDVSEYLRPGDNVLAARVVHFHPADPPALDHVGLSSVHRSAAGGFFLQGTVEGGETVDTDERWRAHPDSAISFHANDGSNMLGETESVDGTKRLKGWATLKCNDASWKPAVPFWDGLSPERKQNYEFFGPWSLTPRPIPPMFETPRRFVAVTRADGPERLETTPEQLGQALLGDADPAILAPQSEWTVDLDAGELTTAYPVLTISGGKWSRVTLTYAEAYGEGEEGNCWVRKGVRDDPNVGGIYGQRDFYKTGGGEGTYEPFWFRAFRFVRVKIEVGDTPLKIGPLTYVETGYPLEVKSEFEASDPTLTPLYDISIRTLRRCMHETYEDCPYYEQLQYTMDTRLEALYSTVLSADDRLMRKAIDDYHSSWHPSGLLQSRFPSVYPQIIPGFALHWVLMLNDHWTHFGDPAVPRRYRSTVDSVLDWFDRQLTPDGLVGPFYYWPYFDWVRGWQAGCPPGSPDAPATVFSLLYAATLNVAAELAEPAGYPHRAPEYRQRADAVNSAVNRLCWDNERGLYRHGPETPGAGVHEQAWAVLSGAAPADRRPAIMSACLDDKSLPQMNFAMQYYLFRALRLAGAYDRAFELYGSWRSMVDQHLTTWAEDPVHGRSDCHAWGSVPAYEFLAEILGVQPAEPGYAAVRVDPQPGPLAWAKGTVITPKGPVSVSWKKEGGKLNVDVQAPQGVPVVRSAAEGGAGRL
ncbi:MAG TPA: alpha-L-rhamnosidase C-terminal domain-containing protein [Armatimonadota bacterium]|jgi:hypothetical protein